MAEFTMPSLGSDMEAGTLIEWLIEPGQKVSKGDIVAVVETQKGAIDIEVFQDGTVHELIVPLDTKVPVGTTLAIILGEGEAPPPAGEAAKSIEPAEAGPGPNSESPTPAPTPKPATPVTGERKRVSPRARKLAAERSIDLAEVQGTGPHGSVTYEDVESYVPRTEVVAKPKTRPSAAEGMRQAIAATMSRANRDIPHYYLTTSVDLTDTVAWLEARNAERSVTERILPAALFMKATARALAKHPGLNGRWENDRFEPASSVHLGMVINLRGGGLVAPAIHDANTLDLDDLMAKLRELVKRARARNLRSSEMSDPTATLTNLGDSGVEVVQGVIFPPQVALIGFGAVLRRPWIVGDEIQPRSVLQLSLAADHRASDGQLGAKFLRTLSDELRNPEIQ
jgi:pyruvate dehydrogenase E2 component (dihydrolipoamide acetyltransferase)